MTHLEILSMRSTISMKTCIEWKVKWATNRSAEILRVNLSQSLSHQKWARMDKCIPKSSNKGRRLNASMDIAKSLSAQTANAKRRKKRCLLKLRPKTNSKTIYSTGHLSVQASACQILEALLKILLKTLCIRCKPACKMKSNKWLTLSSISVRCQQWTLETERSRSSLSRALAAPKWAMTEKCIPSRKNLAIKLSAITATANK